jgi:hypoxanthine phosphoribosyltransferase
MPGSPEAAARAPGGSVGEVPPVVFTAEAIAARVAEMGAQIGNDYRGSPRLLVLGLLKGSFIFLADLVRAIRLPLQVDFLIASSYGANRVSSGKVRLLYEPELDLRGRDVIVVEDIVDSGATLDLVFPILEAKGPKSLELCALLHKRTITLGTEARWVGFEAPQEFLVGYGLDCGEEFRHLPYIGSL